jgi:hypothetical protein
MSKATRRRLAEIAEAMSTTERRVSPMQLAAQLLEEAVEAVELGARRREEGAMNPEDMLLEVEQLLQERSARVVRGEERGAVRIPLQDKRWLAVNVFLPGNSRCHIRVHVWNVSQAEADEILRAPAATVPYTPGLHRAICPTCRNDIPESYPAWYHGPREDRNREYLGFQWHRPDGLSGADLDLIEACIDWLLRYFAPRYPVAG